MRSANYRIVERRDDRIVIEDIGPCDKFMTLTNAAEDVVHELFFADEIRIGQRLFYYDSEGSLGEILIKDKSFAGFKSLSR